MNPTKRASTADEDLTRKHLYLVDQITGRLIRRYWWIDRDDLRGYAYLGLALSAKRYDSSRGTSFAQFAGAKGTFMAIDEMRKDGVLRRADSTCAKSQSTGDTEDWPDPRADDRFRRLEAREFCLRMLKSLSVEDRNLLLMIYSQNLTYKEISGTLGISASAICLRHKNILRELNGKRTVRLLAA